MSTQDTLEETARAESVLSRVVWVTGAGRGLGAAIARAFAQRGACVAASARTASDLDALVQDTAAAPGTVLPILCDVSDPQAVRDATDQIHATLGPVRTLVNAAGINPTVTRSENLPDDRWADILDINLTGTFYCCRAAGQHMLDGQGGAIVNVSSIHGSVGVSRMAAYAASKGGVEALTRSLAVEWADRGVRVNCLAPGYFRTALTERYLTGPRGQSVVQSIPLGRVGDPAELVAAAVFLGSDASSYVSGTTLTVDGGWTAQ